MVRPGGFIIDVPVTLTVAVRGEGFTEEDAMDAAREFAYALSPSDQFIQGYNSASDGSWEITEASLESSSEDSCEVSDELEPEED